MIIVLLALVPVTGVFLVLFAPRMMVLLVWPVVLCYPQKLFHGLLPWNAGLDDLFIVVMAARILLHPRGGNLWPWAKGAVLVALGMLIMEAAADFSGALLYPALLQDAAKSTLKSLVFVLFAAIMAVDVRSERDVHRHLMSFALAMSAAMTLVVVCFYLPSVAAVWEMQFEGLLYREGMVTKRAFGPFNHPADVGVSACLAVPIALALLVQKPRDTSTVFIGLLLLATAFAALIVAKTRAGIVGLSVMFLLMTILSRQRKSIIGIEATVVLIAAFYLVGGEVLGAARQRLALGQLTEDVATRIDIWTKTITHPSPWILFFGEGTQAFQLRLKTTPHNGYLDALFVWGVGGSIMFTLLLWKGLQWSSVVQRFARDGRARAVAWAYRWSLVAIAGLAVVSDPWYSSFYRLITYFLLVVICAHFRELRRRGPPANPAMMPTGPSSWPRLSGRRGGFFSPGTKLPGHS